MANTLVCALCQQEVSSKVIGENDLGGVLLEFTNHCSQQHPTEFNKYGNNLKLLLQIMPVYLMIEHLVDTITTEALDNNTYQLIKQCQQVVRDVLGVNVEVDNLVTEGETIS